MVADVAAGIDKTIEERKKNPERIRCDLLSSALNSRQRGR